MKHAASSPFFILPQQRQAAGELVDLLFIAAEGDAEVRKQERGYLAKNGIDPDTPYTSVTCVKIDGMSFYRWRLLHDDNFHPKSKSLLISAIHRLREDGYEEDAELIEDKYLNFLHPDFMELHAEDYLEAEKFFSQFIHDDDMD